MLDAFHLNSRPVRQDASEAVGGWAVTALMAEIMTAQRLKTKEGIADLYATHLIPHSFVGCTGASAPPAYVGRSSNCPRGTWS